MTPSSPAPSIVWFREDLRLADNPALCAARDRGAPILCLFILETDESLRPHGGASRWWLHHSLASLSRDLEKTGARLDLLVGESRLLVPALVEASGAAALYSNRRYDQSAVELDSLIAEKVAPRCKAESFNGRLLNEPWTIKTKQGGTYGVYSPYWRAALAAGDPGNPLPAPRKLEAADYPSQGPTRIALDKLNLLPTKPDWAGGLRQSWEPGEAGAHARLTSFLKKHLEDYKEQRNFFSSDGTSHLSPHLRFGEISPRSILAAVYAAQTKTTAEGARTFLSEIGWREFDYHVLHAHPEIATKNLHARFDKMPWSEPKASLIEAWQKGRTGYPVVDAGMRQLWQTGYMHNRVRMITASFLIKHLLHDWRIGEAWFWDCLCDADPANNPMNWQWVAGSGADAAPFFRIFNPVSQGQKFDPDGAYVRRWVPELAKVKGPAVHAPWEADAASLSAAGVKLGTTYPLPIIDHKTARDRALAAYARVKS